MNIKVNPCSISQQRNTVSLSLIKLRARFMKNKYVKMDGRCFLGLKGSGTFSANTDEGEMWNYSGVCATVFFF